MNRVFPMYEGDGIIRYPAARESSPPGDRGKTAFAGLFARLFEWIDASVRRAKYREIEEYLGQSTDLADLERRLRRMGNERRDLLAQG